MDFASVKNQIIDSTSNGYGTELKDIIETINMQSVMDSKMLSDFFWDMFIVDALIGNWDRHNGNWGFLYNQELDIVELSPIYDCGSSLYPQMDDNMAKKVLSSKKEMLARVYEMPTSAIYSNGRRLNYYQFISSHSCAECDMALERIDSRIDMNKIQQLIEDTNLLSDLKKEFLVKILRLRKELLLDKNNRHQFR